MEFKSQICTTREQSERLLKLGLKRETADMCYRKLVNSEHHTYDSLQCATPRSIDIPAWSLHRLMEMLALCQYEIYPLDNVYEDIIYIVEYEIKEGYFNKDYLEEKK